MTGTPTQKTFGTVRSSRFLARFANFSTQLTFIAKICHLNFECKRQIYFLYVVHDLAIRKLEMNSNEWLTVVCSSPRTFSKRLISFSNFEFVCLYQLCSGHRAMALSSGFIIYWLAKQKPVFRINDRMHVLEWETRYTSLSECLLVLFLCDWTQKVKRSLFWKFCCYEKSFERSQEKQKPSSCPVSRKRPRSLLGNTFEWGVQWNTCDATLSDLSGVKRMGFKGCITNGDGIERYFTWIARSTETERMDGSAKFCNAVRAPIPNPMLALANTRANWLTLHRFCQIRKKFS